MNNTSDSNVQTEIDQIYRTQSRRIFASLVRLLRDFDLAEEAMQEAFALAVQHWHRDGLPANPRSWLISTARFKAIDGLRRAGRLNQMQRELLDRREEITSTNAVRAAEEIEDDRLRLIFACCHPAIDIKVQIPLTLREVCGLTTEEIARAFLTAPATMAQRLVRGKAKIRDAGIPIELPAAEHLQDRLAGVLAVIYLVFNEGYSASSGDSLTRVDLSSEAIRLGRLVVALLPNSEAVGLLALMLLQESRGVARTDSRGDIVLLEDQDRSLWNRDMIDEGLALAQRALVAPPGVYAMQAAIAAEHARSQHSSQTDWSRITGFYNALMTLNPSPVVALNRAVAIAMRDGAAAGLAQIDDLFARGELQHYYLAHAARADLLRRLARNAEAKAAYQSALELTQQAPEIRFLQRRIDGIDEPS